MPLDLTRTIQPDKFRAQRINQKSKLDNLPEYEKFHWALDKLKDSYDCSIKHRYLNTSASNYLEYEEGNPNFSLFKLSPNGWFISNFSEGNQLWVQEPIDEDALAIFDGLPNAKYKSDGFIPELPEDFILFPSQGDIDELPILLQLADKARELKTPVVIKEHPFQGPELSLSKIRSALKVAGLNGDYIWVVEADANTTEILNRAREVWTLSSGVGFSALVLGKQVIAFRDTDFSCLGNLARDVPDALSLPKISTEDRLKFLSWYINKFTINVYDELFEQKVEQRISMFSKGTHCPALLF